MSKRVTYHPMHMIYSLPPNSSRGFIRPSPRTLKNRRNSQLSQLRGYQTNPQTVTQRITPRTAARKLPSGTRRIGRNGYTWKVSNGARKKWIQVRSELGKRKRSPKSRRSPNSPKSPPKKKYKYSLN